MIRPAPPAPDRAHLALLAQLARAHFLDGRSKVQLAQDHDLSRFQVANLLQEARDRGIVRITVSAPDDTADDAAAQALGIEALVSCEPYDTPGGAAALPRLLADVVVAKATEGTTLGLSWSRVVQAMAPLLPPLPGRQLVQLAGALAPPEAGDGGPRLLASIRAGASWPLWAPLVMPEGATALLRSPEVARTLEKARRLDVAVVAVGRWGAGSSTVWDRVPADVREAARAAGAVAEVSGRLLSADGRPFASPVDDMVVAARLEDMVDAGHTVVVAHGEDRAAAVLAAVRHGLVDTLVCDTPLRDRLHSEVSA